MEITHEKTILVTGGAGFIGSAYLNLFVKKYPTYFFVNVDTLTSVASLENIEISEEPNYIFINTDIRDRGTLEKIFTEFHITDIIHFAAETHVDVSIENPSIFIETNVVGTHNLLTLAKAHTVNRFQQISTDEVYGSLQEEEAPFTEESYIKPNSPYSAAKASADLLVRAYHETYGLDTVITRCSNNYGPRQDTTKLIPLFLKNLLSGKKVPLYGKGENIRDWLYVDDHVRAVDLVFHKGKSGEVYNIGGDTEIKNIEITKKLIELTGRDETAIEYVTDRLGHDFRYAINAKKIQEELGWKPLISFEEGMQKTVDWYKEKFMP